MITKQELYLTYERFKGTFQQLLMFIFILIRIPGIFGFYLQQLFLAMPKIPGWDLQNYPSVSEDPKKPLAKFD